jgi:5-methylcytosine-specific restriction endonuclease McrA
MNPSEWRWRKFSTGRQRFCYLCKCEVTFKSSTVDHFIPKSKGGPDKPKNYRLCCGPCNFNKGAQRPQKATP